MPTPPIMKNKPRAQHVFIFLLTLSLQVRGLHEAGKGSNHISQCCKTGKNEKPLPMRAVKDLEIIK